MDAPESSKSAIENKVKIAFLTSNLGFARDLLNTLRRQEEDPNNQERFVLFPASDKIRFMEICSKFEFDIILIEEEFIDCDPVEWMSRIDKVLALKEFKQRPPTILVAPNEKTPDAIKSALDQGFHEIMIRPLDLPILLQAMHRCMPTKNILSSPQLFKMSASDVVNVAMPMFFEAISETEMTVLGDKQYTVGDIVSLYAGPFDDARAKEIIAVCHTSNPIGIGKSKFRTTFNLQGITPALSRNIRKWIQSTSAKQKSA